MKASESTRRAVVRRLTGLQIESWRLLRDELKLDAAAVAELREWEERRREVAPEMAATLRAFL
ncbi:MAG TPA: hypothetical protein VFS05_09840, partial [Gemmatimonadaceae bacterium]|nr:hypothetical protein [Gemmatimonadaceae bacterium]